jgi:ketosteroid isomerase-like protein
MSALEATMTTQDVANRFRELAQASDWNKIQDELFANDAVSIEPPQSPGLQTAEGIDAIKQKGKQFADMVEEVHGGYTSAPVVGGNFFSVAMGMDCTMKGMGRMKIDEIALYEVKDGKIVREQFFY